MYKLCVRDHVMIAHSLPGEAFGPAQNLHGATYVVDICFARTELDENDIVVDIGLAGEVLKQILSRINYQNLDALSDFQETRSTTERVARWVFDRLAEAIAAGELGAAAHGIERLTVTLNESHIAWASYEADLVGT